MCGIAGALSAAPDVPAPLDAVERFAAAMVHRGPDGYGFHADGPMALGHRRLAIVDLSEGGRQPMLNEDGSVAIVVNGEIYNHQELRADLVAKGHRFRGGSDSEVVAHLYEEVGARTPEMLRGMFALAVWDRRTRRLLLARDRVGEKPLYYAQRPDGSRVRVRAGGAAGRPAHAGHAVVRVAGRVPGAAVRPQPGHHLSRDPQAAGRAI